MPGVNAMRHGYHNLARPEILALIPTTSRRVLDLGCGTGALGKALKEKQQCHVTGIELNKEAFEVAKRNLDICICDNLNRYNPALTHTKYDCIILADILEHLIDPWSVLQKFASVLTDDGVIIASIPNFAHPWITTRLTKGIFQYTKTGITDITHLRFFTKTSIFQMFYRAGLKITDAQQFPNQENPIQYLITAKKQIALRRVPIVTVVVLTYNAWEYTRRCIESIKARTVCPYKLLVVDNGSTDGTVEELRKDPALSHIENSCNLGFAGGFNVGLQCVDTPYFVIANSDVVVSDGWLSALVEHIQVDPSLVALGPRSNYVAGPQIVKDAQYIDEARFKIFAAAFRQNKDWGPRYQRRVIFFLTLFKTEVLKLVGLLDERFELGNFEDDDYCMRIAKIGGKVAIDDSVFIHHYGSKTFAANKIDYKQAIDSNKERFLKKWDLRERTAQTK